MPSWETIRSTLAEHFDVLEDCEDILTVALTLESEDGPICQPVAVGATEALGHRWLVISSPIGSEVAFNLRELLGHNATLAVGALCLVDDVVAVRECVSLTHIPESSHIVDLVFLAGHEGARMRSITRSARPAAALFDVYAA